MFKRLAVLFNFSLAASLALSGCTVDAQLASSLLSSLQKSVASNTDSTTGKATLTAKDLATAADTAGVKVVCGGKDLSIASADDADDTADATTLVEQADTIQPVLLSYGGQNVSRIQININLENELKQLPKIQGQARDQRFKEIQQKYPEMRNARPVPVKGGQGGHEIVFAQYETRTVTRTTTTSARPATAARPTTAARPVQAGYGYGGQQGGRPGYIHEQGGQAGHGFFAGPFPGGFPGAPQAGARPAGAATAVAVSSRPIQGFSNAKGESCELQAKNAATADSSDTTSSSDDTSSDSTDTSDSSAE